MITQCLRSDYAVITQCLPDVCAVFTQCLRMVYAWFTQCLRNVYASYAQCLRRSVFVCAICADICLRRLEFVYAVFTQCLRIVYALQPMSAKTEKLSVNRVNISRHCMFTQVFAYQQCLRSYIFANHAVFPHLRRSSRGSEAATCPESSPGCAQQLRVRTDGNGEEALPGPGQLQVRAAAGPSLLHHLADLH